MCDRFVQKTKRETEKEGKRVSDRKINRGSEEEHETRTERAWGRQRD